MPSDRPPHSRPQGAPSGAIPAAPAVPAQLAQALAQQQGAAQRARVSQPPPLPTRGVESIPIKIKRMGTIKVPLPDYQSALAAGMDLVAAIEGPLKIAALARVLVPTGIAMAIPPGFEGQVRPRSGLAWSRGLTVLNSPGTIDADYRGEIKVLLVNLGRAEVSVEPLERIAQLVVARHARATLELVEELDDTARGAGGYGSTGTMASEPPK